MLKSRSDFTGEAMDACMFEESHGTKAAVTALLSKTPIPTAEFFYSDTDQFLPMVDEKRNPDDHPDWILVDQFKAGDRKAGNELLKKHMGLIVRIARRYKSIGEDDAIQEACMGFMQGIGKCERGMGAIPSTYALHWARAKASRARIIGGLIKIPANGQKDEDAPRFALSFDADRKGDDPREGMRIGGGTEPTMGEMFPDDSPSAEYLLVVAEGTHILNAIPLNTRERYIVTKRFGYDSDSDDEGETLEKIGAALDLTKERVRQILEKILIRYRAKVTRD